jgi:Tfp pilus assembly protein PilF
MRGNVIFYITLLIVVIALITAGQIGKKQDQKMEQTYKIYQNAKKLIGTQKGNNAIPDLEKLTKQFPERYNVHQQLAIAYSQAGRYKEADEQFEIALKIRPALIKNPLFNAQYGENAYVLKQYDLAKAFLQESINAGISPDLKTYVDQLLNAIATAENTGGEK